MPEMIDDDAQLAWWQRDIPSPNPSRGALRVMASIVATGGLIGILSAGIDTTVWYLAAPGLLAGSLGIAWLRGLLGFRPTLTFQIALLTLWLLATIRWCVTDELALGFWGAVTGTFLLSRIRSRQRP